MGSMVLNGLGISDGESTNCDELSDFCPGASVPLLIVIMIYVVGPLLWSSFLPQSRIPNSQPDLMINGYSFWPVASIGILMHSSLWRVTVTPHFLNSLSVKRGCSIV